MRPQQQNRRMRGRNNNNNNSSNNNQNRKGPNPLTRNYESNGPDVKIRGSAQQIAEKYATLARDAMSAGDRVVAENYLQHAEHYNRIIAAAQAQMPIQQVRELRDEFDEDGDDDRDDMDGGNNSNSNNPQRNSGSDGQWFRPAAGDRGNAGRSRAQPGSRAQANGERARRARTAFTHPSMATTHSSGARGARAAVAVAARISKAAKANPFSRRSRSRAATTPQAPGNSAIPDPVPVDRTDGASRQRLLRSHSNGGSFPAVFVLT